MRKIKLCQIIYEFAPQIGGSITHTIELAKHMAPYCERQFVIVPAVKEDTSDLDRSFPFEVIRVKYHDFKWLQYIKSKWLKWVPVAPFVNISFGWAALRKCLWLNRKYKIDIIQAHGVGVGPSATLAGKITGKPVVWMMHGTSEAYSKLSGLYETILTKLFAPDHVLVLDDGSPAPLKFKKMLQDKITVVYHGIDHEFYSPNTAFSIAVKSSLSLEVNDIVILSPHALIQAKGIDCAIKAFAIFAKNTNCENSYLLIAGDGSLRAELEQLTIGLNVNSNVKFLGYIPKDEMPKYYGIADVVVATSLYSNMNRSVQEAMACGKSVVTFNSGGTGRTIIDGETGLLVTPGDIDEFAQKLQILYRDAELRNKLGQNAREFIIKNRSWESRIKVELSVYESLLVTKHRNIKS